MLTLVPCRPGQSFIRHKSVYADNNIGRGKLQTTSGSFELRRTKVGWPYDGILEGTRHVVSFLLRMED
jgi:hypothetical protein